MVRKVLKNKPLKREAFEVFPEDALEFDISVRMPPVKRWTARARVKNIKRATSHASEPEEI